MDMDKLNTSIAEMSMEEVPKDSEVEDIDHVSYIFMLAKQLLNVIRIALSVCACVCVHVFMCTLAIIIAQGPELTVPAEDQPDFSDVLSSTPRKSKKTPGQKRKTTAGTSAASQVRAAI